MFYGMRSFWAITEKTILAADCEGPDGVLGQHDADAKLPMFAIAKQVIPLVERVIDRPACQSILGQGRLPLFEPELEFGKFRFRSSRDLHESDSSPSRVCAYFFLSPLLYPLRPSVRQ